MVVRNYHRQKLCKYGGWLFIWLIFAGFQAIAQTPDETPVPQVSPSPTPEVSPTPLPEAAPTVLPTPTPTETPTPEPSPSPQILQETVGEDLIHFGDVIEITLVGNADLDWRGTVDDEGFFSQLPYVDVAVFALCHTEQETSNAIAVAYAKYFRNPEVSVRIVDRSKRPTATLLGAIKNPQRLSIRRPIRLNELLILGGGIIENANGEVQIFRPSGTGCETRKPNQDFQNLTDATNGAGKDTKTEGQIIQTKSVNDTASVFINIKIADLVAGKVAANPFVHAGDIVTVQEAEPVFVTGGVVAPQKIYFRQKITLTRAIAQAGGLLNNKDIPKITIYQRTPESGGTKAIEIDYAKIQQKLIPDFNLQAYDIIEVTQNGRSKSPRPPVIDELDNPKKIISLPLRVVN